MHLKQSFQHCCLLLSFLFYTVSSWSETEYRDIHYSPVPAWVEHYAIDLTTEVPLTDIEEGVYFRVVENQVRHSASLPYALYIRRALDVVSAKGMEYSSGFNIDFDPSYQSVELHDVKVIRGDNMIDKSSSARISVIQREERMEALIYDGTLTANVIIDDVRVGDVVEYSYSRIGRNPIYGDALSLIRKTNYSVPVQQLTIRLLTDKNHPFQKQVTNTNLKVQERDLGAYIEYSIHDENIQPLRYEAYSPRWYDPYGQVHFSELTRWNQVVNWALPLYNDVITTNDDIHRIAADIKAKSSLSGDQISAALQFVQNEIRYLGIENGLNSHMPSEVTDILQRRYGDCKDKTVLFISILKALDIEAFPTLVNTEDGPILNTLLPSNNIFDHVIVKVVDGTNHYWLDPTNRYQTGSINDISEAQFGYALVVKEGVDALENMNQKRVKSTGRIHEKFDLTAGTSSVVKYLVKSQYQGKLAENMRYDLVADGIAGTQQKYIDYYNKYYSGITVEKQLKSDDSGSEISINEEYSIPEFWTDNDRKKGHVSEFYANYISSILTRDDSDQRTAPYFLGNRRKVTQVIEVEFPDEGWNLDDEHLIKENEIFDFEYRAKFDEEKNLLVLTYTLDLKKGVVGHDEYPEYLAAREDVVNILSYQIIKYYDANSSSSEQINWSERIMLFFMAYLSITLLVSIGVWLYERNHRPEDESVLFYPVSLERFYVFSVLTFNLYIVYWAYKNWVYIKENVNSKIIPFGRALFQTLWFYSFNGYFKKDSEERFGKNKVYSEGIAGLLFIVYILLSMAQSGSYFVFSLLALPLLFVTHVNYINEVNNKDSALVKYNSHWSWRQVPLLLFCAPLLVISILASVYLIPSSDVEKGSRIWSHDLRFMKREGVLPATENIQYFFSNDFWSIRADGNGFTENRVFSYWNENDQLSIEKASYRNIKGIDVQYGQSSSADTIVTISRLDDSNFMLFLSGDKRKDKRFVKKMTELWKASKAKEAAL